MGWQICAEIYAHFCTMLKVLTSRFIWLLDTKKVRIFESLKTLNKRSVAIRSLN